MTHYDYDYESGEVQSQSITYIDIAHDSYPLIKQFLDGFTINNHHHSTDHVFTSNQ